jgi:hypothetical protein
MKPLKALSLLIGVAAAFLIVAGGGVASATVLCTSTATPCPAEKLEGTGTEVKLQLKAGTQSVLVFPSGKITCSGSTIRGKTTSAGGSTSTVSFPVETLTFESCTCAGGLMSITTLKRPAYEIHSIAGTDNGTVTDTGTQMTYSCPSLGISCAYGVASGAVDIGTLTGGASPFLDVSAKLPRLAMDSAQFICGETATWTAEYEVVKPKPLYVESS